LTEVTTTATAPTAPSHGRFGPSALLTPANIVTVARLLLVPVLVAVVIAHPVSWTTFTLAFLLACTDGIDGYIARRQGSTRSGAFLDPLADKVLVLGALYALVAAHVFPWLPVALITVREVAISAYRSYWGRRGLAVPARYWAKVKTVVQELAIGLAVAPPLAGHPAVPLTVLWIAVGLTLVTGAQYLIDGRSAATTMV
jgi:CDP-diacylglycerol--glycerol-3-phosphate 3-phosphatidyltransferase